MESCVLAVFLTSDSNFAARQLVSLLDLLHCFDCVGKLTLFIWHLGFEGFFCNTNFFSCFSECSASHDISPFWLMISLF